MTERTLAERSAPRLIRKGCLECCGGQSIEVHYCPNIKCHLWEWRFGKRPGTVERRMPHLLDRNLIFLVGLVRGHWDVDGRDDDNPPWSPEIRKWAARCHVRREQIPERADATAVGLRSRKGGNDVE